MAGGRDCSRVSGKTASHPGEQQAEPVDTWSIFLKFFIAGWYLLDAMLE
jgi:hypothetical protein